MFEEKKLWGMFTEGVDLQRNASGNVRLTSVFGQVLGLMVPQNDVKFENYKI